MNSFVELFERYGFVVEEFGPDSYIADNGVFCVPFTVHTVKTKYGINQDISAVSFLSEDKEAIKEYYRTREKQYIGCEVFSDWMSDKLKFIHVGRICNHDHALFEVQDWLERIKKIAKKGKIDMSYVRNRTIENILRQWKNEAHVTSKIHYWYQAGILTICSSDVGRLIGYNGTLVYKYKEILKEARLWNFEDVRFQEINGYYI